MTSSRDYRRHNFAIEFAKSFMAVTHDSYITWLTITARKGDETAEQFMIRKSVEYADALLAELERTEGKDP